MSFKNLPNSLVDSVTEIMNKSVQEDIEIINGVVAEGLKTFGVSALSELSEADQKAFHSWARKEVEMQKVLRLLGETTPAAVEEEDCGCGDSVDEDEEKSSDLAQTAHHNSWKEETAADATKCESVEIAEAIAVAPDQLAHNGAVGVRDATKAHPVHADVIRDSSPLDGKTEFRMLVQFPTNERCVIVPPPTLPGAPTVAALKGVVEGLPYYCEKMGEALEAASSAPHNEPNFKGDSDTKKSE